MEAVSDIFNLAANLEVRFNEVVSASLKYGVSIEAVSLTKSVAVVSLQSPLL
jgi:hypothetical protein